MKAVKNKYKEKDEIEAYFSDAKRKSLPVGVVFFLLILIIISGCAYYYFIIDSPQNIFLKLLNQLSTNIEVRETNYDQTNIDFSLDLNLLSPKKDYVDLINIINELSINGNIGIDPNKQEEYLSLNAQYQEKDLFGISSYFTKKEMYLKLDNIYDKVLKSNFTDEEMKEIEKMYEVTDKENENTDKLIESLIDNISKVLKDAKYTKTYEKIDKTYVKKLNVIVDTNLLKEFYNNLINDSNFIESFSKLENINEEKTIKRFTDIKNNLKNKKLELIIYISVLNNKFIKLEYNYDDIRVVLTKDINEIKYKYYEEDIIKYQGYVYFKDNESNYQISLSLEDIEAELTIELNSEINIKQGDKINLLDTTNTKTIESLTENDYNIIEKNIANNEILNKLITDIMELINPYPTTEDNSLQTT